MNAIGSRWTLGAKLAAVGLPFLLLGLFAIAISLWVSWQLDGGAAAVNEAGRMRMQAYRLAWVSSLDRPAQVPAAKAIAPDESPDDVDRDEDQRQRARAEHAESVGEGPDRRAAPWPQRHREARDRWMLHVVLVATVVEQVHARRKVLRLVPGGAELAPGRGDQRARAEQQHDERRPGAMHDRGGRGQGDGARHAQAPTGIAHGRMGAPRVVCVRLCAGTSEPLRPSERGSGLGGRSRRCAGHVS